MALINTAKDYFKSKLTDEQLSPTAVMVLQAINSAQAAKILLDALDDISDYQKPAIIFALAGMKYKNAAEKIFELLPTDNSDLEKAALTALATLGYQPAEQQIRNYLKQNNDQSEWLLILAQNTAMFLYLPTFHTPLYQ